MNWPKWIGEVGEGRGGGGAGGGGEGIAPKINGNNIHN